MKGVVNVADYISREVAVALAEHAFNEWNLAMAAADGKRQINRCFKMQELCNVTCGSRTMWFNKNHPAAIYTDKRAEELKDVWKSGNGQSERPCVIAPDVRCDFTDLPFEDNSFALVVFDPPHLRQVGENAWIAKKYGRLDDNWPEMLHAGFEECMRVLKPDGVLIFKWSEAQIPAVEVWKAIGQRPLFGHHSGKKSQTFWGCFMKFERIGDGNEAPDV